MIQTDSVFSAVYGISTFVDSYCSCTLHISLHSTYCMWYNPIVKYIYSNRSKSQHRKWQRNGKGQKNHSRIDVMNTEHFLFDD